mgnify:CR=1 FL=1
MKKLFPLLFSIIILHNLTSQSVGISETGTAPHSSAMLDIQSDYKGMLTPRVTTTNRMNISNPASGLILYDTDTQTFWYYNGQNWVEIGKPSKFSLDDCGSFSTTINTVPSIIEEDCGTIYDSGGENGFYADGESFQSTILSDFNSSIRQMIIHNVVLFTNDTLRIESPDFEMVYTGINFDMDTFYLPASESIDIIFTSDAGPSNGDGFEISWNTYTPKASGEDQRDGFFCNAEKQSFGGGIQLNNEWTDGIGFRNINFGVFAQSDGESSIVIGTLASANDRSVALGERSIADNQAVAIGLEAKAELFGSVAIGRASAVGNTSIAMGFLSSAEGNNSVALGLQSRALGIDGIAIGRDAFAHGNESAVLGLNSTAFGNNSMVIGNEISSICDDCIIIGKEGFGSPKIGINKLLPTTDLEVGGNMKAEKLDIQDDFGEIAITSNDGTLQPSLTLFKTSSFNLVGKITSNLSNNLVIHSVDGILNQGNTFVNGTISTSSLSGGGNKDVYANSQGKLIVKPEESNYYVVNGNSFVSENENEHPLNYKIGYGAAPEALNINDEVYDIKLYAPVNLPSGVNIEGMKFIYQNTLEELQIDFRLVRINLFSGISEMCAILLGGMLLIYIQN